MTLSMTYQIESQPIRETLSRITRKRLPEFRQRLVEKVLEQTLQQVVSRHPVETGRARDAWLNAAEHLRGAGSGQSVDASSQQTNDQDRTLLEVTNQVDYVVFLENGTSRMRPHHMVHRAMAETPSMISHIATQLFKEVTA